MRASYAHNKYNYIDSNGLVQEREPDKFGNKKVNKMIIELFDVSVFASIVDEKIKFTIPLSSCDDFDNDEAYTALKNFVDYGDDFEVFTKFSFDDVLNSNIDMYEMPSFDNTLDISGKPTFDMMRAELVEIIARIDALKFTDPDLPA
jgi:hypothetical protein